MVLQCRVGVMARTTDDSERVTPMMYHLNLNDSRSKLFDRTGMDDDVVSHISEVMAALGRVREAERALADASQRYMQLNETDMRALHFLIVAEDRGIVATPSAIAAHLGISAASTTKLLDRLEKAGHVARHAHPTDRRALVITIAAHTRQAAKNTVGARQARRFYAAARLTQAERDVVIRFLNDMAHELSTEDEWEHGAPLGG